MSQSSPILDFFRCPEWFAEAELRVKVRHELACALDSMFRSGPSWRESSDHSLSASACQEMINMLRCEHYEQATNRATLAATVVREAYYLIRPLLGVAIRRHLQRWFLRNWRRREFPAWPIDRTADILHEALLMAAMASKYLTRVPFIWFWPAGYSSCCVVTHDVETEAGLRFCPDVMDMDDSQRIKSSFQLVPEQRYTIADTQLQQIRERGFEINIHDLNHDGHLYRNRDEFRRRAARINEYGRKYDASGFRAGALYRNQDWYGFLHFAYDMSVPNVGHLDPQRGGCCTLFPYFIGDILELPVTAIQDYSLFHVLHTYSVDTWRSQMDQILGHNGMFHVIAHPDYLKEERAKGSYLSLLACIAERRAKEGAWVAKPGEVNTWWRQRSNMRLVLTTGDWSIEGEGSDRAAVAYAEMQGEGLVYRLPACTTSAT